MAFNMTSSLRRELVSAEFHFRKACEQVFVLSRQVEHATQRYQEAEETGNKVLRYNIRLRLSVLEGVRNMFYEFAAKKATDIVSLQRLVLVPEDDVVSAESDLDASDMDDLLFGASFNSEDYVEPDDDSDSDMSC